MSEYWNGGKNRSTKESELLSKFIYDVEHADYETKSRWMDENKTSWKPIENVRLERSDDMLMWYLWKRFDDQARSFFKAVPSLHLDKETIYRVLDAQSWACI